MSRKSRVVLFSEPHQPLELSEVDWPRLQPGELLVRVTCCTLCGSDVHTYLGHRSAPVPTILGHEILGRVAELPPGEPPHDARGEPLRVGDRITWSIAASCGSCFFCRESLPQKCEHLFKYGHERIVPDHPLSGGLADYCHLAPGTTVLRIPDTLPDHVACPANCATATVTAALRIGGNGKNRVILVQGAGTLGLTATAMAHANGARAVIVSDVNPDRLQWARRFGATEVVNVADDPKALASLVADQTCGRGVDLALEMTGATAAIQEGLGQIRIGGTYVWVGAVFPDQPVTLSAERIVRGLISIHGVHNYTPADLVVGVRFLEAHAAHYPFAELVSSTFPLAEADRAFQHAVSTRAFRVAVVP